MELETFASASEASWLAPLIGNFVESLAYVDLQYLRRNPGTPSLYGSGVKYSTAHETCVGCVEVWRDVPALLSSGVGNCKDFTAWRLAELWISGVQARAYVTSSVDADGGVTYHVQLKLPDGRIEDASVALGMLT